MLVVGVLLQAVVAVVRAVVSLSSYPRCLLVGGGTSSGSDPSTRYSFRPLVFFFDFNDPQFQLIRPFFHIRHERHHVLLFVRFFGHAVFD